MLSSKENTKDKDDEKNTESKNQNRNDETGTQDPVTAKQDKKATNGLGSSIAKYGVVPFTSLVVACVVPFVMHRVSLKSGSIESRNTGEIVDVGLVESSKSGGQDASLSTVEDKQEDKKDSDKKA